MIGCTCLSPASHRWIDGQLSIAKMHSADHAVKIVKLGTLFQKMHNNDELTVLAGTRRLSQSLNLPSVRYQQSALVLAGISEIIP